MKTGLSKTTLAIAMVLALGVASNASATPVDAVDIVVRNGVEFAWVSPCAPVQPSCGNTLVMFDGWQIAQAADFLAGFTGLQDLYDAFLGGARCASDHFNSGHAHCDGVNVNPLGDPVVWNGPTSGGWAGNDPAVSYAETFVVRGAAIPEPGTIGLLASGMALAARRLRRRRNQ